MALWYVAVIAVLGSAIMFMWKLVKSNTPVRAKVIGFIIIVFVLQSITTYMDGGFIQIHN